MAGDVRLVVLIVRPLRRTPVHRRHEIVVARSDLAARVLGGLRLGLTAARHRFERRRDVGHLLDALAHAGDVGCALHAARPADVDRARLIPVDAVGTDDVVECPALLAEAAHMRLATLVHDRLRWVFHDVLSRFCPSKIPQPAAGVAAGCASLKRCEAVAYFTASWLKAKSSGGFGPQT